MGSLELDTLCDYAEVNGTRLYYEVTGSGQALILIHGFSTDCRQWKDQVEFFASHYKVICYDMRGFGKSAVPLPSVKYSHAEDLKALLDYLDVRKAHILGHSFGGRVSIAFAILYPERTLSMIGADPALEGYNSNDPDFQEVFAWIDRVWTAGAKHGVEAAKKLRIQFSPLVLAIKNPDVAHPLIQMIEEYSGWHWINEDPYQPLDPAAFNQLEKFLSPTLLIIGELNPSAFHLVADIMTRKISNCRREIVSGVAHMLNMEDPQQFNSKLFAFLQDLSPN
jgi:pimeloyl-ACP methyl ester carboxylesterase